MSDSSPDSTAERTARRTPSRARKWLLALAAFVVAILLAEGGQRALLALRGKPYDSAAVEASIRGLAQRIGERLPVAGADTAAGGDPLLLAHPYFGFDVDSGQPELAAGAQYFRQPESVQHFDLVLVGGSVAAHFVADSGATLKRLLEADPRLAGRKVRMHAYPRGGIKQPQQLNQVSYMYCVGWRPDAVIDISGFNELALSNYNADHGLHPLHPSQPQWAHLASAGSSSREQLDLLVAIRTAQHETSASAEKMLRLGLSKSALLGEFALSRVNRAAAGYHRAYQTYGDYLQQHSSGLSARSPPYPDAFEERLDLMVRNWFEASHSLHALCSGRGSVFLQVLQPTLLDEGSKPLSERERASGLAVNSWSVAVRNGYPRLREVALRLVAQGVRVLDASRLFADVTEDLYYDACHFTRPGNERLAAAVATALLDALQAK